MGTLTAYRSLQHGTADVGILLGERAINKGQKSASKRGGCSPTGCSRRPACTR
ncbi:MAG: hypothetical protein U1F25_03150 [Rubrivivax sp.]